MWGYGPYGMMSGDGWGGAGWMMLFGGFFWILLLVLAVAVVVWLVRGGSHADRAPAAWDRRPAGLDILEERYARGEISRDEFLQKKRDMAGRGSA